MKVRITSGAWGHRGADGLYRVVKRGEISDATEEEADRLLSLGACEILPELEPEPEGETRNEEPAPKKTAQKKKTAKKET